MEDLQQFLERAAKICLSIHIDQRDKAGKAYFLHPFRVAMNCDSDEEKIVALLHDCIEDGDIDKDFLVRQNFPENIINAIFAISRHPDEEYEVFIKRLASVEIARNVKIKDLEDNLNIIRFDRLSEEDLIRCNKYLKALDYLKNYKEINLPTKNSNNQKNIKTITPSVTEKTGHKFYLEGSEWMVVGELTNNGKVVILKGSLLRLNPSSHYTSHKLRNQMLSDYCEKVENGYMVMEDLPPMSPSTSSGLVQGRSSNGKVDWKDASGRTLGSYLQD